MSNERMLQLAFSIYENPGVYALLLGSGVSRAAEIPTGWEVIRDLLRKIAVLNGQDIVDDDLEDWYAQTYDKPVRYDDLLEFLGPTQYERQSLLQAYFEPTEDERSRGAKLPTKAHKAIAWLIKQGYVRVVLTTNFDRLLEQALDEIGITPDVVSTQDQLLGMRPLQHSQITIIKLHGDYRDSRIKNTEEELLSYTSELNALLDRVFDEYGLIVCGWSAEWDMALRSAIERVVQRRYSTYWSAFGELSETAMQLVKHRDGIVIEGMAADDFWPELMEMVGGLKDSLSNAPLSMRVAVERVKRLVRQPGRQPELEEMLRTSIEDSFAILNSPDFKYSITQIKPNDEGLEEIQNRFMEVVESPLKLLITLCWYGEGKSAQFLAETIERWSEISPKQEIFWYLPPAFLIYAIGIAALATEAWEYLHSIFYAMMRLPNRPHQSVRVVTQICEKLVMAYARSKSMTRFSQVMHQYLRPLFEQYVPSDVRFHALFDTLEVLLTTVLLDFGQSSNSANSMPQPWAVYNARSWGALNEFWHQAGLQGADWPLIKLGFWSGSTEVLSDTLSHYDQIMRRFRASSYILGSPEYQISLHGAYTGEEE